ncbi:MAG: NAD(P)H-dependent oxidoreductase subunit E [Desulfovermiculus sp.]|nr:NAD(P)H-dependent oxidoreductase subunit E [Desulfovermiculus sp.]
MSKRYFQPAHEDITDPMWDEIDAIIARYKSTPGAVIPVLRECQNQVGYLPMPLLDYIGQELNIAKSEVFGVASFYSLFSFTPKGRHIIKVCKGTACFVKGVNEVIRRIEDAYKVKEGGTDENRRFTLQSVRCLGACGFAPVVVVDEDTHGCVSADKINNLLDSYD